MMEKEKELTQKIKPAEVIEDNTPSLEEEEYLALLPLKNVVILPKSILPIIVGRKQSIQAVEYALKHNKTLLLLHKKIQK